MPTLHPVVFRGFMLHPREVAGVCGKVALPHPTPSHLRLMTSALKNRMNLARRFTLLCVFAAIPGMSLAESAWADETVSGKPILIVSGKIANKKNGEHFAFDMALLETLPQHSLRTRTPWYTEAREYTGPLLRDVLELAGAQGNILIAQALNDYKVSIPVSDAMNHQVIIARLMDGRPMPVRDKGPLFIMYPFDEKSELRSQTYYGRAAWQLREIHVK